MKCFFKKVVLGTSYRFRETAGYWMYMINVCLLKCYFQLNYKIQISVDKFKRHLKGGSFVTLNLGFC